LTCILGRAFGPVSDAWIWPPGKNGSLQDKYDCIAKASRAHASVVNLARTKYPNENMKFSMPLIIAYYIPVDPVDTDRANQLTESQADWLWAPLVTGDYPSYLRSINSPDMEGRYLPTFTADQKSSMRGTLDYLAINYYSATYFNEVSRKTKPNLPHAADEVSWQYIYPRGIREISKLLSSYYASMGMTSKNGKAEVMISECGYGSTSEAFDSSIANRVNDSSRQRFFAGITASLRDAIITDNTPITSFIAWSLLDNLE
jgi:beta-glucosidase